MCAQKPSWHTDGAEHTGAQACEHLACDPHVSTHTTPETTGCKRKAAAANTTFPVCVRVCICTDTDCALKSEEKHKIPADSGGLGGGREQMAGDT